ncbi:MAG: SEC-C metal-binding domain-containing protein, partial [Acidimicrobiales bacterium]
VGMKMTLLDVDERDATGCVATLEVLANPGEPSVPEGFGAQLAASLAVFGDGNGVPTRVDYLLCQLAADAPGLMGAVLAPVSELLLDAGLEERQGHAGRPGTDWEAFEWLQEVAHVAAGGDLDRDTSEALIAICRLNRSYQLGALKELDRDFAGVVAQALQDDELAEAFAGVAKVTHSAPTTLGFLNQVRGLAKTAHRASVAWTESLVCGADGQHERAEECLRFALLADPDHPGALEDTAWYASDRGDPGTALRYLLRREGDDLDERRISLLRHFSPDKSSRGGPGRNAPCDCGSGRKFKHCCLASANQGAVTPLPARTWWLWDKLTWWLSRTGRLPELYEIAMVLSAGEDHDIAQAELDVDVAVSLVLFQDGAVSEFLEQRAPLLPADEVALVRRWANEPRSLYEVVGVASGGSVTARDLRTDQSVVASHRYRAAKPGVGDVIFAHAAFDGSGHQFLGGIVQIPEGLAQTLLSGLDQRASGWSIAVILGEIRRRASVRPHG